MLSFQQTPNGSISHTLCKVSPEPIEPHIRTGHCQQQEHQTEAQRSRRNFGCREDPAET